jgi:DNA-binding NtrC family response regulator
VRELQSVIHHAVLMARKEEIEARDLALDAASAPPRGSVRDTSSAVDPLGGMFLRLLEQGAEDLHERVQESLLRTAYRYCQHNQVRTAQVLGMSRNALRTALGRIGIISGRRRNGQPSNRARTDDGE